MLGLYYDTSPDAVVGEKDKLLLEQQNEILSSKFLSENHPPIQSWASVRFSFSFLNKLPNDLHYETKSGVPSS